jgi:hypothetical protein
MLFDKQGRESCDAEALQLQQRLGVCCRSQQLVCSSGSAAGVSVQVTHVNAAIFGVRENNQSAFCLPSG